MNWLKVLFIGTLFLFSLPVLAEQNYLFSSEVIIPRGGPTAEMDTGDGLKVFASSTNEIAVGIFQLSQYEITVKQFKKFMEVTKYQIARDCRGRKIDAKDIEMVEGNKDWSKSEVADLHPAVCIGRDDILVYLAWVAKKTGRNYQLASEVQWEYSSRAGSRHDYFSRSNEKKYCPYENIFGESGGRSFERGEGVDWSNVECNDDTEYNARAGRYRSKAVGQAEAKDQGRSE